MRRVLTGAASLLLLVLFAACSDALSDKQSGALPDGAKAYLSLSVTDAARFIAPAAVTENDIAKASLLYKVAGSAAEPAELKSWTDTETEHAIAVMCSDTSLSLECGSYDFTLNLYTASAAASEEAPSYTLCQTGSLLSRRVTFGDNELVFTTAFVNGTGSFSLTLFWSLASGITKAEAALFSVTESGGAGDGITGYEPAALPVTAGEKTASVSYSASSVPAGLYYVKLFAYENEETTEPARTWCDMIRVLSGCTTTAEKRLTFVQGPVTYYVSAAGSDSTGDGSLDNPLASVAAAVALMDDENLDYIVCIDGSITGAQQIISDSAAEDGSGETVTVPVSARTITLTGAAGLDNDGVPQDALNMNKAGSANAVSNGTVLIINTAVPVTITNLKVTGGYGSGTSAGGITISQGATVSLGNGALITGNKNGSNGRGGAIHNEGTLFMYGSAVIGDRTNGGKTDESAYAYAADSSSYNDINNKKMANWAPSGGGIYNGSATDSTICAKLYLGYKRGAAGAPVQEALTGGLYYNGGTGGALYNAAGSCVYFDSGTFAWNGTEGGGGAIHNAGTVEMTGGTIEHNRALGTNHGYGGGVYNDGASSKFIMSAGTINHNLAYRFNAYGDDSSGGGVYNAGTFYMFGTAVIGDKDAATVASADTDHESDTKTSAWGNKAKVGGGMYNASTGFVYLGYKPDESGNPVEAELAGGIYHNYATGDSNSYGGGAIYNYGGNYGGIFKIASGTIAYNATGANGGAIWHRQANYSVPEISGGTIENNAAGENGGAIFIASTDKASLSLSDNALIPAGNDNAHDIYLATGSKTYYPKITIAGSLREDFAVRLTPGFYDPSMALLVLADGADTTIAAEYAKFSVSDEVNEELGTTTAWYIGESGALTSVNPLGTLTMTIEHDTYSDISVSARYYASESDYRNGTSSGTSFYASSQIAVGKTLVFTVTLPSGVEAQDSGYIWYVDGAAQTARVLVLDTAGWTAGVYDIALELTDTAGKHYSSEYHITVKAQ